MKKNFEYVESEMKRQFFEVNKNFRGYLKSKSIQQP
jgi:hypothetical protein